MTAYKKLIVSGCSFTVNDTAGPGATGRCSWAQFLAEKYNLELVNLAVAGAGNKHIADSLIVYLEQNSCDITEVLIGAMWSGIERHHWTISLPKSKYTRYHKYEYTDNIFLTFPQEILGDNNLTRDMILHDPDLSILELAYFRGLVARQLDGLLSMIHLTSYLTTKGYTFFQTHFFDPDGDKTQSGELVGSRYADACDNFGIARPETGMVNFAPDQFLGNWAANQNLIWGGNDRHPTVHGHKLWTETVLIPQLIQQKLLPDG
jgi:hypothetical protein